MTKPLLNIWSHANKGMAHGVRSAYNNYLNYVVPALKNDFDIAFNQKRPNAINHIWTINLSFLSWIKSLKENVTANVMHAHFYQLDNDLNFPLAKLLNRYLKYFYTSNDYFITVSPEIIDQLAYKYDIDIDHCRFIPNFVPSEKWKPANIVDVCKFYDDNEIASTDFVVVAVGQLNHRKGVEDFVKIAQLLKDHPIKFIWVGGYSFFKYIYSNYRTINKLINQSYSNICFAGIVDHEQMQTIYSGAHLFIMPSLWEAMCMSMLEASQYHLPLLLRNNASNQFFFNNSVLAYDNDDFAKAILKIKDDLDYRKKLQEKSALVSQKYSIATIIEKYKKFYKHLLNKPCK